MSFSDALAQLLTNQQEPLSKAAPALLSPAATGKVAPLTGQFLKLKADFESLQDFNDPLGVYARMPLGWEIR